MAGDDKNGYLSPGDRLCALEQFETTIKDKGCPHHWEVIELKKWIKGMIVLQVTTLLGVAGAAIALFLRATGHG